MQGSHRSAFALLVGSLLLLDTAAARAEVPVRWQTGAAMDVDRSGDLRAEAGALIDRVQASSQVVTVLRRRAAMPETIRVWRRALDGSTASCSGRVDVIPFEDYVRGVLPHEWIASWDPEALRAGAVAIRTYAAAWVAAGGKYDCADLDDTTASQVYRDDFDSRTDAAVAATEGVYLVKDGAVVFAEYSAENGDPTDFGVDEPLCAGQTVNGHGRGTCQWGTQRWASEEGKSWKWIALHYYPGATLAGVTVAWDAALAGESYPIEMTSGEEAVVWIDFDNLGARTWNRENALLGTTGPRDRASAFAAADWISPSRPTGADSALNQTGTTGRFSFTLRAPEVEETTVYSEQFGLVTSGGRWFGPSDDAVSWTITVHPAGDSSTDEEPPADMDGDPSSSSSMMGGGCAAGGGAGTLLALGFLALLLRARRSVAALIVGMALMTGCAQDGVDADDPSPRTTGDGLGGDSALIPLFREAEAVTGVPASVVAAVSYSETRLRFVTSADHGQAVIGLMALSEGGVRDATRAASLAGVNADAVYSDPRANVLAGAALLADLRGDGSWNDAIRAYGSDAGRHLQRGFRGLDADKRWVVQSARPFGDVASEIGSSQHALGFPGSIWNPAYSGNFQASSRGAAQINYVVIHTTQGSYGGTISWFKNPDANVSSHYVVRSSDGERTHMVDDSDIAWHDACFNSETIGIEHEGFVDDPDAWYTEAMYTSSAELTAWLCDQYGIPKDRDHIFGHGEAPDCSDHTDPGSGWNWAHYMELVQHGGEPIFDASYAAQDTPMQMVSGEEAEVWYEFVNDSNITWGLDDTRLGTAEPQDRESAFYVDGNWLGPNRPTGADHSNYAPGATGRFTFMIRAPEVSEPTTFTESFQLVQEGVQWFGPVASMTIEVTPQGWTGDDGDDVGDGDQQDGDGSGTPSQDESGDHLNGGCALGGQTGGSAAPCAILLLGAVLASRARRRRRPR